MQPSLTEDGEYYVWEAPDQGAIVHLHLDVVDRMLSEVMRGFGAVPKRGAEVGGLLIGTVEAGEDDAPAMVRIEDFEQVPCEYRLGPSYLFTDEERPVFESAAERWQQREDSEVYAVGYFRSNTREQMKLGEEDVQLMDHFFPEPYHLALLIQPYATKVSQAGFFQRDGGKFPESTALQFPFRRRELTGQAAPPRRSLYERTPRQRAPGGDEAEPGGATGMLTYQAGPAVSHEPVEVPAENVAGDGTVAGSEAGPGSRRSDSPYYEDPIHADLHPPKAALRGRRRPKDVWVWIPLSTIFLLIGVAVGFWAAMTVGPTMQRLNGPEQFELGLSVSRTGDNLTVRWNREAPAVRSAQNGMLEIEEEGVTKVVNLQPEGLQIGTVIYQASAPAVRFRLVLYIDSRLTVAETLDWSQ